LDICWHYTSTGGGLISGASPTTRISRYSPTRTIHNAPPTSRVDKLPAANPYASQIDTIARDSTNGSLEEYLDASGTSAFLVIHDDELLYEKYFDGYDKNSIQTSFSMAKSFALALVGIAIDEGQIKSIDEPITNYIPELLEKDKRFGSITIRNLLTMSSGRTGCVARYSDGKGCSPGKQG
jgi:CubicO group peptidase (beta-lactamase class C family)